MKERRVIIYDAFDGTPHETEAECVAYERTILWKRLVGLSELDVQKALEYLTPEGRELGDILAKLGTRIYDLRRRQRADDSPSPRARRKVLPAVEEGETATA